MKKVSKATIIKGAMKSIGKRNIPTVFTWAEAHPNGTGEALARATKTTEATAIRQLREARRVMDNNLTATVLVKSLPVA